MAKQDSDQEYVAHQVATGIKAGRAVGLVVIILTVLGIIAFVIWAEAGTNTTSNRAPSVGVSASPTSPKATGTALAAHVDAKDSSTSSHVATPSSGAQHVFTSSPSAPRPSLTTEPSPVANGNTTTVVVQPLRVVSVTKRTTPTSRADLENVYCDYLMNDGTTKTVYYGTESAPGWGDGITATCNSHP
jgi:hypothetical protein